MEFDSHQRRILAALQDNGSLSDSELAEITNLPEADAGDMRKKLEATGVLSGYHAFVNREHSGFGVQAFVEIVLRNHERQTAEKFAEFVKNSPQVLEAHALTEGMDFMLKVVAKDLEELSSLISDQIEGHNSVKRVRALMSLETIKETSSLPI